jgi:RHS repeat-associated protein
LNRLTNANYNGKITVAGYTTGAATNVTVNTTNAFLYRDNTYAVPGMPIVGTYTAVAFDGFGRGATNTLNVSLPSPVTFTYDVNGNLKGDFLRTFFYDNENQLTGVIQSNAPNSSTMMTNLYDARMRRRIRRDFNFQGGAFVQTNEVRYVYDGMLVIQERDSGNTPQVSYTRGLDLSGTIQGGGGIGGLLARSDTGANTLSYYHADGNGNITAMADSQQVIVARYLYDSFGNLLAQSGKLADVNVYRFSSKEYHPNSRLYYYGYRFFEPNLQRWLNRDPIGEGGGINLYQFVGNDPVNFFDFLGLDIIITPTIHPVIIGDMPGGGTYTIEYTIPPQGKYWFTNPGNYDYGDFPKNTPEQIADALDVNFKKCRRIRTSPSADKELNDLAKGLGQNLNTPRYNLFKNNCRHFADTFCKIANNLNQWGTPYDPGHSQRNAPPIVINK